MHKRQKQRSEQPFVSPQPFPVRKASLEKRSRQNYPLITTKYPVKERINRIGEITGLEHWDQLMLLHDQPRLPVLTPAYAAPRKSRLPISSPL